MGPSRAGLPPRAQPPPPAAVVHPLSPAPRAPWPRPPSVAQGGTAGGQPCPWGERSFLTLLSGVWSLLKDGAAAWLLTNVLFLSVFTEAACHPSHPQAHACVHTGPLAPEPQRASGPRWAGGSSCRDSGRGASELPPAKPPSASGPSEPLCWARVLVLAHRVPAPCPSRGLLASSSPGRAQGSLSACCRPVSTGVRQQGSRVSP